MSGFKLRDLLQIRFWHCFALNEHHSIRHFLLQTLNDLDADKIVASDGISDSSDHDPFGAFKPFSQFLFYVVVFSSHIRTPFAGWKSEKRELKKILSLHRVDQLSVAVVYLYCQRHLSYGVVRCASETRVIGSEGHLHFVERALVYFAAVNQALGSVSN